MDTRAPHSKPSSNASKYSAKSVIATLPAAVDGSRVGAAIPAPTKDARRTTYETREARACSRFALRKCRKQIPERRGALLPSAPMRCRLAQPKGRHHDARLPFASANDEKTTSQTAP